MKRHKKLILFLAVLLPAISAYAGVSFVMNNSFEADGYIGYVSPSNHPYWWDEIDIPDGFSCSVDDYWNSLGEYSLVLLTSPYEEYEVGEKAMVSQKVYLEDVNTVSFDLKLTGEEGWDSNNVTAFIAIDGNDIWESNEPPEYFSYEETILVPDYYKDTNSHTLTVGIRADVNDMLWYTYEANWDFIRFDTHCDGLGHHQWDVNLDCEVDKQDLYMIAENWLADTTEMVCRSDVFQDDQAVVNFNDYADVINHLGISSDIGNPDSWPVISIHDFDFNFDGHADMSEIMIVVEKIASSWLEQGSNLEADYNQDKIVNFKDYAFAVGQLGARDSLYGW